MSEEAPKTVEINDAVFCADHVREVCADCDIDTREENDAFFGFDTLDREPLSIPTNLHNKEGVYQCKKHANATCNQCFGWKKQIVKLQKDAKKAGKNSKKTTNLY